MVCMYNDSGIVPLHLPSGSTMQRSAV